MIVTRKPTQNMREKRAFLRLLSCSLAMTGKGRPRTMKSSTTLIAAEVQPWALMSLHTPVVSPCQFVQAKEMGRHCQTETRRKAMA